MSVENDILSIAQLIADAKDCLRRASDLAVEASGYEPGRQCPDCKGSKYANELPSYPGGFRISLCKTCNGTGAVVPPRDGDPVLLALADRLHTAQSVLGMAVTPEAEALFKDTQKYADEVQDRKDGQSY